MRVRLCAADAKSLDDCALDPDVLTAPGHSRVLKAGPKGDGSTPFVIKAEDVERIGGGAKFQCDAQNPCKLYAFNLDSSGNEIFSSSAFAALGYALSTIACPQDAQGVGGVGASSIRTDFVEWQAETCHPPSSLNVTYSTSNSVNGKMAFAQGLTDADFALSGIPLTAGEVQTLASRKITPVYVPVSLGALVLVYNIWYTPDGGSPVQIHDLQLSPATVAGILQGHILNLNDPAIKSDNAQNYPNGLPSKQVVAVGRADNSAATWWLTSWFWAVARDTWEQGGPAFKTGPTTIFPAGNGVNLATGSDAVANQIRNFPGGQGSNGIPDAAWIGFVDYSVALKLGLPVAALRNQAGDYVKPTKQSLDAAIADGAITADGVFTPDFTTSDPNAYPLPVVTYAIAPAASSQSPPLDPTHELILQKFLHYAVTDGQNAAELRGYEPLPDVLSAKSSAGVAQLYAAPAPTATKTPSPTPAVSSAAVARTATATSAPAPLTSAPVTTAAPAAGSAEAPVLAAAHTTTTNGPSAPIVQMVSGAIKLLSGGRTPASVSALLWLGAIVVMVGRAISVVIDRKRRPTGTRRTVVPRRTS